MLSDINRNNYRSGDFSTNYITGIIGYNGLSPDNWYIDVNAGYRCDFELDPKVARFLPAQNNRYGKHRLLASAKFHSRTFFEKYIVPIEISFQANFEYILNSTALTSFPDLTSKYPLFTNFYIDFTSPEIRSFGIIVNYSHGRDPLNIRYDDPVSIFQIGLSFDIVRYTSERFDDQGAK